MRGKISEARQAAASKGTSGERQIGPTTDRGAGHLTAASRPEGSNPPGDAQDCGRPAGCPYIPHKERQSSGASPRPKAGVVRSRPAFH